MKWEELSETARNVLELAVSDDMATGVTVNFILGRKTGFDSPEVEEASLFSADLIDEIRTYSDRNEYGDSFKISRLKNFVSVRQTVLQGHPLPPNDTTLQI